MSNAILILEHITKCLESGEGCGDQRILHYLNQMNFPLHYAFRNLQGGFS